MENQKNDSKKKNLNEEKYYEDDERYKLPINILQYEKDKK